MAMRVRRSALFGVRGEQAAEHLREITDESVQPVDLRGVHAGLF